MSPRYGAQVPHKQFVSGDREGTSGYVGKFRRILPNQSARFTVLSAAARCHGF